MVDYHRMGNMVWHLVNTTSTTFMHHHPSDLWKSPKWTVIRIQALAVVAIVITFLLAVFGSCRRWSNRWIVQKGFFAAQVLSLSLGTYSIGMMQSSAVKSEMYPVWTVSLFTLFGCVDPVTSYNGLDYKGPLSKLVYGICLYCGYVLLMSISSISSVMGNTAIGVLTAITFSKGFHRSMALVQQSIMRNWIEAVGNYNKYGDACVLRYDYHVPTDPEHSYYAREDKIVERGALVSDTDPVVLLSDVDYLVRNKQDNKLQSCYDVCVSYCLSHSLHGHFLGLNYTPLEEEEEKEEEKEITLKGIDYRWALNVVEIELAFLYEVFFSGNAFLHYYQAKTASLWALASLTGICFVGVAAAIPGTMSPRDRTNVVGTTTVDVVITFFILASLALLQLVQLIRCWTSNWARLAVVCAYVRNRMNGGSFLRAGWLRLKAFVATSTNWFDKYLWQEKIGQYRIQLPLEGSSGRDQLLPDFFPLEVKAPKNAEGHSTWERIVRAFKFKWERIVHPRCVPLAKMLGLHYFWKVVWDLLGSDPNKRGAIRLDDDVKVFIVDFLGKIESDIVNGNWLDNLADIEDFLPYSSFPDFERVSRDCRYTRCLLMWYVVTWYCELAEQEREKGSSIGCWRTTASCLKKAAEPIAGCFIRNKGARGGQESQNKHRCVANALSKYCAYLIVSMPELLPGLAVDTRREYDQFVKTVQKARHKDRLLEAMIDKCLNNVDQAIVIGAPYLHPAKIQFPTLFDMAHHPDRWKTLADVWVRMLVYGAPYGNKEVHMQQLSQGGEFITHLWALLYHLSIREWKRPPDNLRDLNSIDDARRIRAELFHENEYTLTRKVVVVAFLDFLSKRPGSYGDQLAAASELEKRVMFYRTTSPEIAELFHINPAAKRPALIRLNEEGEITVYDGEFNRYAIADFVSHLNKLPLVTTLTRTTVPSLLGLPIQKMIILLSVATESSKSLPNFKEAAKLFKGKLLFVFLELDNSEAQEAVHKLLLDPITFTRQETARETQQAAKDLLDRSTEQETTMEVQQVAKDESLKTLIGQETKVLFSTRDQKAKFHIIGEVSLNNIKKIAQDFLEDKLYMSEPVPESNDEYVKTVVGKNIDQTVFDESKDVLLVIYAYQCSESELAPDSELAKHLYGIDSLVIATMNAEANWHPRVKCHREDWLLKLSFSLRCKDKPLRHFYPARRKHIEPITFNEKPSVKRLYKFIKKHASIPFEPISTLEEMSSDDEDEQIEEERSSENEPISTVEEMSSENRQTEHEIEEV